MKEVSWERENRRFSMSNETMTIHIERSLDGWFLTCSELAMDFEKIYIKNETPVPVVQVMALTLVVDRIKALASSLSMKMENTPDEQDNKMSELFSIGHNDF